jgi:hypothetical protein
MADIDQILSRLKSYKFVTIVVTVAAIVAGIASFTDSVRKITGFVRETFVDKFLHDNTEVLIIKSTSDFSLSDENFLDTYWFRISHYDGARYSLMIHIKLNYNNSIFNKKSYLASIPPLTLKKFPNDFITYRLEQTDLGEYVLYLKFKEKPRPNQEMQLSAGTRVWTVQLGAQQWESYQKNVGENKPFQWWGAQGTLLLTLKDPDWPVLSSVRLLPLREANSSFLEVIVENRTDVPLALAYLLLKASHPTGGQTVSCYEGDPVQVVTLNWQQIISTAPVQEAEPSWTKLSEADVLVPTKFNLSDACSGVSHFRADVPLRVTVEPKALKRIALKILELPRGPDVPHRRNLTTLRNWHALTVSFEPSDLFNPKSLMIVDKGQDGQSDSLAVGQFRPATYGRSERHQSPSTAQLEKDTGASWSLEYRNPNYDPRTTYLGYFPYLAFGLSPRGNEGKMAPVLTSDKSPEDAAMAFFSKYAALFPMEDPRRELTLVKKVTHDGGGSYVRFIQHVNQVPVFLAETSVAFNAKGQISWISATYIPNLLGMSTRPAFDPEAAVAKAKVDLRTLNFPEALVASLASPPPELFIYVHKGTPVLAYHLYLTDQGTEGRERVSADYWINAKSGKIMR